MPWRSAKVGGVYSADQWPGKSAWQQHKKKFCLEWEFGDNISQLRFTTVKNKRHHKCKGSDFCEWFVWLHKW